MTRLLILLCLALVVYHVLGIGWRLMLGALRRGLGDGAARSSSGPLSSSRPAADSKAKARVELIPCAKCGVHVPRQSAMRSPSGDERLLYCSDVCRRQA